MKKLLSISIVMAPVVTALILGFSAIAAPNKTYDIDPPTGLIIDEGFIMVKAHCTACHSAKLVTQNRMSRDTWLETIRWMQKSQGLWPLMDNEKVILDYLEKHYSPKDTGRRKNLPEHLLPTKD
ncbi:hypothetical protein [Thalassotalea crassostreae]|nr:hypothetical protein [Thalassotalea crassostreae]